MGLWRGMDFLIFCPLLSLLLAHLLVMWQYGRKNFSVSGHRSIRTTRRRWLMVSQIALWSMCLLSAAAGVASSIDLSRNHLDHEFSLVSAVFPPALLLSVVLALLYRGGLPRNDVRVSCVQLLLLLPAG